MESGSALRLGLGVVFDTFPRIITDYCWGRFRGIGGLSTFETCCFSFFVTKVGQHNFGPLLTHALRKIVFAAVQLRLNYSSFYISVDSQF